jgi:Ca-activated chloride channel family protein
MSSISLSARLEFQKIPFGKKKEAHLLVTLEGQKYQGERKPLSLAAVVDVSGSMSGEKIEFAKRSLKKLVEHMTDQDTLAILAFTDDVFTVTEPARMTQEAKDLAIHEIAKLHHMGSTNLSGATLEGYQAIRKAVEKKVGGSIERTFLFTDGQPTAGDTSFEGLVKIAKDRKPENSGLTCFGYGNDYNKELMTAMTKAGGGNEYHITTPDQAPAAFGREIGGLLSCVAQAVKVTIKTKPDVKIKEVLNDFDVKGNDDETEAVISVDDVYGSEKRRLLVRLELPEMDKSGHAFKLADVKVDFEDLVAKEARFEEVAVKVEYVKEAEADKDSDKEVLEQVAVQKAAKAQEQAIQFAQVGNYAGAQAAIQQASAFCMMVGTPFAANVAGDLDKEVKPWLSAQKFQKGGARYLKSNSRSYSVGRGQTLGASHLYNTEEQTETEMSFSKPDVGDALMAPPGAPGLVGQGFPFVVPGVNPGYTIPAPMAPFPQNGPVVPGKGGNLFPPHLKIQKPSAPNLTKKRTRR